MNHLKIGRSAPFFAKATKGLGVLFLLIVMMMWLAGAFVREGRIRAAGSEAASGEVEHGEGRAQGLPS